jgi:uncharacterized protein (DUF3084 family)
VLKTEMALFNEKPKFNRGCTYYSNKNIEAIRLHLLQKAEDKLIVIEIDTEKYISNQEVMRMFGVNTNRAHYVVEKHRLPITRFTSNVNYYEREKAIAVFSEETSKKKKNAKDEDEQYYEFKGFNSVR